MPEYQLKFTDEVDEDDSRQRTLNEITEFIAEMYDRPLAIITLDAEQTANWDEEGDIDYQDEYGRQIVAQVSDGETEALIIRNMEGLPVALASQGVDGGWQGLGIEKRLRLEIAAIMHIDDSQLADPEQGQA